MTFEDAIAIIESALAPEQLTELQKSILEYVWNGESYLKMSFDLQYNHGYLKDVGAGLWRQLSDALGEKVKKYNLRTAVARYQQRQSNLLKANRSATYLPNAGPGQSDPFSELVTLQPLQPEPQALSQWLMQEQRPVVAVFDVSRLHKTLTETSTPAQSPPPALEEASAGNVLQDMLRSLEPELSIAPTEQPEVLVAHLLEMLSQRRCLLVLAA